MIVTTYVELLWGPTQGGVVLLDEIPSDLILGNIRLTAGVRGGSAGRRRALGEGLSVALEGGGVVRLVYSTIPLVRRIGAVGVHCLRHGVAAW